MSALMALMIMEMVLLTALATLMLQEIAILMVMKPLKVTLMYGATRM